MWVRLAGYPQTVLCGGKWDSEGRVKGGLCLYSIQRFQSAALDRPHRRVRVTNYKTVRSGKEGREHWPGLVQPKGTRKPYGFRTFCNRSKQMCRLLSHVVLTAKVTPSRSPFRALCCLRIRRFQRKPGSDRPSGMDRGPGVCPRLPILWRGARRAHPSPTH